jgi:hypothetical protein
VSQYDHEAHATEEIEEHYARHSEPTPSSGESEFSEPDLEVELGKSLQHLPEFADVVLSEVSDLEAIISGVDLWVLLEDQANGSSSDAPIDMLDHQIGHAV